jgi:hypothetical protein
MSPRCGPLHPSESIPVTQNSNQYLTDDDTDDFEVIDGVNPLNIADFVLFPAGGEGGLEKGLEVSNGEEHVTAGMRY